MLRARFGSNFKIRITDKTIIGIERGTRLSTMLEKEIIKLLHKISGQLGEISDAQKMLQKELKNLHAELTEFHELSHMLDQIPPAGDPRFLN